jgi:hypothetical protein
VYPYQEDPSSLRLGEPLYRPFVPVALANGDRTTFQLTGLIDTGADSVLVSDYLAEQLGVDLDDHEGETTLGVGMKKNPPLLLMRSLRMSRGDGFL